MRNSLFGLADDSDSPEGVKTLSQFAYLMNQFLRLNDYKTNYRLRPGYHRFFHTKSKTLLDSVKGRLRLATDPRPWDYLTERKLDRQYRVNLKKEISEKLYRNTAGRNIGPLGFEEGESLYDNRLLNRGWFPEKII